MTLKGLRAQAGMSIPEAAIALGVSERTWYRLESGATPTKRYHLLAMIAVMAGLTVKETT